MDHRHIYTYACASGLQAPSASGSTSDAANRAVASLHAQGLVRPGIETATNSKREVRRVLVDLAPGGHRFIVVHGWREC